MAKLELGGISSSTDSNEECTLVAIKNGSNKRIAIITLSAGVINAILNYILIPIYGIDGAAYATLYAYIIVSIFTIFDVAKKNKLPWGLRK